MTARTAPPLPPGLAPFERLLTLRLAVDWKLAAYLAVFAAAFALRFWDLGARALHHDESIHADFAFRLLQGGYVHNPVYHAPFYYHVQALAFLIFGTSDYTARITAAVFGSGIVALPLLLRRHLGVVGTFAAVAFLGFSPVLVYFSRFFREDIYMGFFTLATAVCMWRYVEDGRDRWLYGFALAFTGSMLTKEGTFLTAGIFLLYLDAWLAAALARQTLADRGLDTPPRRLILTGALVPYAWFAAALWPFIPRVRRSLGWRQLPRPGDLLILLGTLVLPLLTPLARPYLLEPLGILATDRLKWEGTLQAGVSAADARALVGLFAITLSASAFVGLQWRPKTWLIAFGLCGAIYLTLMTSLWTNTNGLVSGPWGSLDYWITQQDESRGDEPWFYYYMVMGAYEFLPLALCIAGLWWATARGNAFSRFLAFWLIASLLLFSYTSEKMPWNNVHLAIPACLLAAWTANRAVHAWPERPPLHRLAPALLLVALAAMAALLVVAFLPGGPAAAVARAAAGGVVLLVLAAAISRYGKHAAPAILAVALISALGVFSVRTMVMAAFERGDVPKDILIYVQSSPEIPRIASQIDRLATVTGQGRDLPIAVDSTDAFAWPWVWYLRDYRNVAYIDFKEGPPDGNYAVLLVNASNRPRVDDVLAARADARYGLPTRYPHRWWFPETYKDAMSTQQGLPCVTKSGACGPYRPETWKVIGDGIVHRGWLNLWLRFIRDHDPDAINTAATGDRACNSCGSVDSYAYFPANYNASTGTLSVKPVEPPRPGLDAAGRPLFGGVGTQPGQFFSPVDIETDAAGNLYVIDRATKRLQKFDSQGNFLASLDVRADARDTGEASDPWGLEVGPDGTIVVADTFGYRIRIFDAALKPLTSFGQPVDLAKPPGPFDLFGPRDAAFDAAGNIWVTDTGNHRLVVYTKKGEFVRAVGERGTGPGQFQEPVGIAIAGDGTIFVADMYNGRVVLLNRDGAFVSAFPVSGWGGQDAQDKPYLHLLRDGRLALSLPLRNEVRLYDRTGTRLSTINPPDEPLSRPYGIAESADGKLWVVEGGAARVRLFAIP